MATRVDLSACTAVPLCSCGWRGEATSNRTRADAQADEHRRRAHPGDRTAAAAARKRRQRARS